MKCWEGASDAPEWEARLASLSGDVIFDIGANGGMYSRMWAKTFRHVVSLEPNRESFNHLKSKRQPSMTVYNVAASDHDGTVTLTETGGAHERSGQYTTGRLLNWAGGGPVEIPCTTLDLLAVNHGTPDVVKIDVEGHEDKVLAGARDLIARKQTRWLIEVHSEQLGEDCWDALSSYKVERTDHLGYAPGSEFYRNHFYLDATP